MQSFRDHLNEELKDDEFREKFEAEKELLELALKIVKTRREIGLTQQELALKTHITQQQLSKIENGIICNIITFLKVCYTLGIKLTLEKRHQVQE